MAADQLLERRDLACQLVVKTHDEDIGRVTEAVLPHQVTRRISAEADQWIVADDMTVVEVVDPVRPDDYRAIGLGMHHYEADSLVTRKTVHQSGESSTRSPRTSSASFQSGNEMSPRLPEASTTMLAALTSSACRGPTARLVRAERNDAVLHATAHRSLDESGRACVLLNCRVQGKVEITPILDRGFSTRDPHARSRSAC